MPSTLWDVNLSDGGINESNNKQFNELEIIKMEILTTQEKPTIKDKIRWGINDVTRAINNSIAKLGLKMIHFTQQDNNYIKYAKSEFEFVGWTKENDEMQNLVCQGVIDLLALTGTQGHSGGSAPYALNLYKKLSMFEPLGALQGTDDEWRDTMGDGELQNKRCSHVFKRKDGTAYDINGKVFTDEDGCSYTNSDSFVDVSFPYIPKVEYVKVKKEDLKDMLKDVLTD